MSSRATPKRNTYGQRLAVSTRAPAVRFTTATNGARRAAAPARHRSMFKPTSADAVRATHNTAHNKVITGHGSYKERRNPREEKSFGRKLGGILGHGVQTLIQNLTGFGDYNIEQNSLFNGGMSPPQIVNSVDQGGFILRHREYIGDINATTAFTNRTYGINPGLLATFPWLSGVAEEFEEYELRGLVYEFKSTSSDAVLSAATSSALGSVIMATTYGTEPAFTNKMEMLNYEFANSDKPSVSFYHPVECKRDRTPVSQLYVRTGAVPTGEDKRLYDLGTFQIATEGMQASSGNAGELWATFEICLYKPKMGSAGSQISNILTDKFVLSGWDAANPLGTTSTRDPKSSLGGTIVNSSGFRRYQFPATVTDGNYLVMISWTGGTSVTASYPSMNTFGAISFLQLFTNNSASSLYTPPNGTTSVARMTAMFALNVNSGSGNYFEFTTGGVIPQGLNQSGDLLITQIDQELAGIFNDSFALMPVDSHGREPIPIPVPVDELSRSSLLELIRGK